MPLFALKSAKSSMAADTGAIPLVIVLMMSEKEMKLGITPPAARET